MCACLTSDQSSQIPGARSIGEYPHDHHRSHDRFFLDRLATQILSFEPDGGVLDYDGNYTEFHDWKVARHRDTESEPGAVATGFLSSSKTQDQKPKTDLSKNQRRQLESRIREIEDTIPALEAEAARLTLELSSPSFAADYERLAAVTDNLSETESHIKALYTEWELAAEQLT
jgi:ATP-binding cassette subfamily F protein uup